MSVDLNFSKHSLKYIDKYTLSGSFSYGQTGTDYGTTFTVPSDEEWLLEIFRTENGYDQGQGGAGNGSAYGVEEVGGSVVFSIPTNTAYANIIDIDNATALRYVLLKPGDYRLFYTVNPAYGFFIGQYTDSTYSYNIFSWLRKYRRGQENII